MLVPSAFFPHIPNFGGAIDPSRWRPTRVWEDKAKWCCSSRRGLALLPDVYFSPTEADFTFVSSRWKPPDWSSRRVPSCRGCPTSSKANRRLLPEQVTPIKGAFLAAERPPPTPVSPQPSGPHPEEAHNPICSSNWSRGKGRAGTAACPRPAYGLRLKHPWDLSPDGDLHCGCWQTGSRPCQVTDRMTSKLRTPPPHSPTRSGWTMSSFPLNSVS